MKKILSIMTAAMLGTAVSAQETYDNAQLATKDLNGTARYVGMGGAMEALGADLSTIGTNPAGIGMFRRGMVAGSFGFNTLSDAKLFGNANKTNMSFDQAGFVYSMRSGRHSMLNFGFNYTKSKNFDQILTAAGRLNNASQNKLSAMKNANGVYTLQDKNNGLVSNSGAYSQADYLYSNVLFNHYKEPAENKLTSTSMFGIPGCSTFFDISYIKIGSNNVEQQKNEENFIKRIREMIEN